MSKKAKATRYHKTYCRSRTEARYATFCDVLHLPYRYEVEDDILLNVGKRYLPDFYHETASGTIFSEIKGKKASELERAKCSDLAYQHSGASVLLFCGSPFWRDYTLHMFSAIYEHGRCQLCKKRTISGDVEYGDYCSDCGNALFIEPDPASKTVVVNEVDFYERPYSEYANEIGLKLGRWEIPTNLSPIYPQANSSLDFAFFMATRARYEYLQHNLPLLYQGSISPFNTAFQTQEFTDAELLYNQDPSHFGDVNCAQRFVDVGLTSVKYYNDYLHIYQRIGDPYGFVELCQSLIACWERALEYIPELADYYEYTDRLHKNTCVKYALQLIDTVIDTLEGLAKSSPSFEFGYEDFERAYFTRVFIMCLWVPMLSGY